MVILLVTDCQSKATKLRHVMAQMGYDCPLTNVIAIDAATNAVLTLQPRPEMILFVLSHDYERSREVLQRLHEASDARIIAVGSREPEAILTAVHAGVDDYLDETGDLHTQLLASFGRACSNERRRPRLGEQITVLSASGGCGQTFLATNLAVTLAASRGRTGLVDLDLRSGDIAAFLSLKPRHSIADLCRNADKLDQKMFEQSLTLHLSSVAVLAAPDTTDEALQVTPEGVQTVLRFARAVFPAVVIDLKTFFGPKDYAGVIQNSTAILLLFRLDFASVRNCQRILAQLEAMDIDRDKLHLIVSRYGQPKEIEAAKAESVLAMKIGHYLPDDPKTVNTSINCGTPIVLESPRSPIAKAVMTVAHALAPKGIAVSPGGHTAASDNATVPLVTKVRSLLDTNMWAWSHKEDSASPVL